MTQQPLPSLLDSIALPPELKREPALARAKARLASRWSAIRADPARWARFRKIAIASAAVVLVGGGIGLYFWLRPVPRPDYLNDDLDGVLNYTLLTDEFNRLPVDERLKLIGELVARFKTMNANDSVLMAAFAAGIAGAAREQLMENGSRLAVDVWDKYAVDYAKVPEKDREAYLENSFVEFTKMMEGLGGKPRDIPDEQRLEEGRRQAKRDLEFLHSSERGPKNEDLGRMFTFMNQDVGKHASSQQRVRGQQMMRDMTRQLRGQDITTGKPKGGG